MHFSSMPLVGLGSIILLQIGVLGAPTYTPHTIVKRQSKERADAVKEAFIFAWNGYSSLCWGYDELLPVSNTCGESRNGWGASAVDALSTALVMELPDIVNQILDYIPTIDFRHTSTSVSLFETNIRYLGGMMSAYDLLTGPLSHLANSTSNVNALLTQSKNIANLLKTGFNTPTGIPLNTLNFTTNTTSSSSNTANIAEAGTLVLEWCRLSDLTNDTSYCTLASKAEAYLLNPLNPGYGEPFPGLIGQDLSTVSGDFTTNSGGWVGGSDSYYEYLIKMYIYDSDKYSSYADAWEEAADSTIKYLTSHPSSRPDLTFLAAFDGTTPDLYSEHLSCFDGGNFILAGTALQNSTYTDYGLALVQGCRATYAQTATGIGPEIFEWNTTTLPANDTAFYNRTGFWIEDAIYDLRPEVIESYYYAYRATGNGTYADWAWEAFVAINTTTRTSTGFTEIGNVNVVGGGEKEDLQESFLFAEVMKYAFLIHADDSPYQVFHNGKNQFVYNTEAHPFRVAGTPV
ncbi:MAG: maturation of Asn-linked oligosaccharides protein [Cirrosporium novae-zelandiae]|nr:MAG: maturation of Asn-linked oligosaccharides protein [Cirrosporium novae-zelandiae]